MTIGERIKKLRRILDLTQQKFGERIGIKGNTVAQYELERSNPVDAVVSLICREFNVREEWLRTGEGEIFKPAASDALDRLAQEYELSNASYVVVEKFVNLRPEKRDELIGFLLEVAAAVSGIESDPNAPAIPAGAVPGFSEDSLIQAFKQGQLHEGAPKTPEELEKKFPPDDKAGNGFKTG